MRLHASENTFTFSQDTFPIFPSFASRSFLNMIANCYEAVFLFSWARYCVISRHLFYHCDSSSYFINKKCFYIRPDCEYLFYFRRSCTLWLVGGAKWIFGTFHDYGHSALLPVGGGTIFSVLPSIEILTNLALWNFLLTRDVFKRL